MTDDIALKMMIIIAGTEIQDERDGIRYETESRKVKGETCRNEMI